MHPIASSQPDEIKPGQEVCPAPLIVHVIYHLGVGGLENGLVNLINHIPPDRYRHAIVCLKGYSDFRSRIVRENVEIVALHKRASAAGGQLVLSNLTDGVYEVFDVTRLTRALDVRRRTPDVVPA